jgi:hypothetical protein
MAEKNLGRMTFIDRRQPEGRSSLSQRAAESANGFASRREAVDVEISRRMKLIASERGISLGEALKAVLREEPRLKFARDQAHRDKFAPLGGGWPDVPKR